MRSTRLPIHNMQGGWTCTPTYLPSAKWIDGWMDGRTDGRLDGWTDGAAHLGALPFKTKEMETRTHLALS